MTHTCYRCGTENELLDDGETRCIDCGSLLAVHDKALADRLDKFWENKKMPKAVLIGSTHRHYKNGKSYIVVDVPQNPNTEEMFIVYQPVDRAVGERSFVRPLDEFWEKFEETDPGRDTSAPKSFA